MTWPKRQYEHRPLNPGEDPAAEDLGNIELVNSSGMQNTVAVLGLGALIVVPISWALARAKQWQAKRRSK
jgi:hypothetical protein